MADSCQKTQEMTLCIEEADAIDALEKLQEHENEVYLEFEKYKIYFIKKFISMTSQFKDVYKCALNIIETWFGDEEEQESGQEAYTFQKPAEQNVPFSF